ncbi:uncharacterized protein isoform X2 [Notothenia coriiceps]|uniref:Dynein axonemal assembly factor 8 n=1 Tax=Notothenia coriiceps TaxID=8208 RepID=A0A6I9Q0X1_9TELE|nr:PREDICTED: uncharacterized protein LOC104966894 isoform X2 [Notothenia coriiceps]
MDLNNSSCWDSIREKVKQHIPTIDFDSSPSENEEVVTVFQRPAGLSLKVPKGFDPFSMGDDESEKLMKPCWSENRVKLDDDHDDDDDDDDEEDDDDTAQGAAAPQWRTEHSDVDVQGDACKRDVLQVNGAKLNDSVKPKVDKTKSNEGFPILSFARLDQWDLDEVLQNLKKDGLPLRQRVSAEPSQALAGGEKNKSQQNIMERLVAFCGSQSTESMSEPLKGLNHIRQNNVNNTSVERIEAELQLIQKECPTVYIDLRCVDTSTKQQRTSPNVSSEPKSPAKLNTHQTTTSTCINKPNLNVHAGSQTGNREVTGKSLLLQKIREMRRNENAFSVPGNGADDMKENIPHAKKSSHVQFDRNLQMESPKTTQQRAIKETNHPRDQTRQQVRKPLQHEQRKILKQLEKHRPTKSVNQKQPAAERTDVLYDFEVSHLQAICTLSADIESKGCMLLIVDLSTPGTVGARAHGRNKRRNPAPSKPDVYNTLVAWFLSLAVPQHDEEEGSAEVPFWVAGLQQLWTEDGLALHVLAVARQTYTPRKRDRDIHTRFYNHVCRFLSETLLTQIAHWLPQLKNVLDQQTYASPIDLPSSCLNCFISTTTDRAVIVRTFSLSPGFYWQTLETQERVCKGRESAQELHTEVSVALGRGAFFLDPLMTHYTLQLILHSGLDVCGLRLLYPSQELLGGREDAAAGIQRTDEFCQPVLALAVRGLHAHKVLADVTSSLDPLLLRNTGLDPRHCRGPESALFYPPPKASGVHRELCFWFSGRIPGGSAPNHNRPLTRVDPSKDRTEDTLFNSSSSPSLLCATTKADLLLVVSPAVPPCCFAQLLAVCELRGFRLLGVQRLQLQSSGAAALGLSSLQAPVFCSPHPLTLDQDQLESPSHCLVLLLRKENAAHHSVSLPAALMRELKAQRLLGSIHSGPDGVDTVEPSSWFHTVPYSSHQHHIFVRCMWAVPDPSTVILSHQRSPPDPEVDQVVVLTLSGKDMTRGLSLLHRALTGGPDGEKGLDLLALKWLPALTRLQAQELSPYEVGEKLYNDSLDSLMAPPALLCALRWVDAFASLRNLLPNDYPGNLSILMSPTQEVAFRQTSLFFFQNEMIAGRSETGLLPEPQTLLTVCLLKPTVWNQSVAQTVHTLQLRGLSLVGLRVLTLDKHTASSLLPAEDDPDVEYMCSGPSLALCLQGEGAVTKLLDVAHSNTGIYGSASHQKAIQDVRRLFPEGLCCSESSTMRQEQILSLRSDPSASLERGQSCTRASVDQEGGAPSMAAGHNGGLHSSAWQTTCLLIPVNAPPLSGAPPHLELLERLLGGGCHLVVGRMSLLDPEQRRHIAETLMSSRGEEVWSHLPAVPCLIVALQGKAVVTGFNSILESIYKERTDLEQVGEMMIYPETQKEAEQLMGFLFDDLSTEKCQTNVP